MIDIYNIVSSVFFPTLPPELYFIIPISCVIMFLAIIFVLVSPFFIVISLSRR